ncbi:MAG: hypothetical protein ABH832_04040 [bacterium]
MKISPAILVSTYDELEKQLNSVKNIFEYAQLDIMDGKFVSNKSFNYNEPEIDLNKFFNKRLPSNLKLELHLMVADPLTELKRWKKVKNIFRVIFHIESSKNPNEIIKNIKNNKWQVGIALNPKTPIESIAPFLKKLDVVLFMTVIPGKQGGKFIKKTSKKIQQLSKMPNAPTIAVDGAITKNNIQEVKKWGVEIFNIGGALMSTKNIKKALKEISSNNHVC